jgi:hypothetical protein
MYNSMDSVIAVNELMELVYTFAPQTKTKQLVNFCSTSRVAPLKQLTILKLELCAATLLGKLYKKATRALNMTKHESYLWTDSSIVLTWIQGPSNKWKTFVGNRVATIQEDSASNLETCANSGQSC